MHKTRRASWPPRAARLWIGAALFLMWTSGAALAESPGGLWTEKTGPGGLDPDSEVKMS